MSEKITFRTIWHEAGISGIVLAAVSTAYFVFSQWLSGFEGQGWAGILNFIVDLVKIVACIWLLRLYLTRFKKQYPDAERRDLRRLGTMIAMLSALVFAAVSMAYFIWNPEVVAGMFDKVFTSMQGMLDANARAVLDHYQENFSKIIFFCQFIYCFFIGWVLTCILVPRIVTNNPFDEPGSEADEKKEDDLFE